MIEVMFDILPEAKFVEEKIYPMCKKWRYKDYLICIDCGYLLNAVDHKTTPFEDVNEFKELLKKIK